MTSRLRTAVSVLAAALLTTSVVATSASAAPRQPIVYDALGDSYASGYGVPPYEACGRSQSSYAVQVDGRVTIELDDYVACAGATTTSLVAGGLLDAVYAEVAAAAPNADVIVLGYPRLFSPEYGAVLGASAAEQEELNAGADLLNAVIAAAAERHGFEFVDVTDRFVDHAVNTPTPWLLGPFDEASFHPDARGYQSYTAALTAAVKPSRHG